MRALLRGATLIPALAAVALATGCTAPSPAAPPPAAAPAAAAPAAAAPAAAAVVPTRTDTAPTRVPPPTLAPAPSAGTVQIEPGPFTDRLAFDDLALQPGERPTVTATVANTVDVSELIVLQLRADFYDTGGRLLGSGTATYADEEFADTGATALEHGTGVHDDSFAVTVASPQPLPAASSAILTVAQLVNE